MNVVQSFLLKSPTLSFLLVGFITSTAFAQVNKPNVVIIMADQLRYDVVNEQYTPNIDKLAQGGVVFNRTYAASPLCVPSRGSFYRQLSK